jgi:hypothetical protein
VAVLTLTLLILGGGIYPQAGVASRFHAAVELTSARELLFPQDAEGDAHDRAPVALNDESPAPNTEADMTGERDGEEDDDEASPSADDLFLDDSDRLEAAATNEPPAVDAIPTWDGD